MVFFVLKYRVLVRDLGFEGFKWDKVVRGMIGLFWGRGGGFKMGDVVFEGFLNIFVFGL